MAEFMSTLSSGNMTLEFPDLDPASLWERIAGGRNTTDTTPGKEAAEAGMSMKHPVVFVPGFTSVGLEIWRADPCLEHYFRQRVSPCDPKAGFLDESALVPSCRKWAL